MLSFHPSPVSLTSVRVGLAPVARAGRAGRLKGGATSLEAIARLSSGVAVRAWREPGGVYPCAVRFALIQIPQASHCLFKVARRKLKMSAHLFVQFPASFVCASLCRGSM